MATRLSYQAYCRQRCLLKAMRVLLVNRPPPQTNHLTPLHKCLVRYKHTGMSDVIRPLNIRPVKTDSDDLSVGEELAGKLSKEDKLKALTAFFGKPIVRKLAHEKGMDQKLFYKGYINFRKYVTDSDVLPPDLHIIISDITRGEGNLDDLFVPFLKHCYKVFPHLECMDDLKKISDLTMPANWYPEARTIERKLIFHAGPTNSGKTYQAMKRFMQAESGMYCGPLKLLAVEVFNKCNAGGTPCDLITGEERRFAHEDGETAASHVSCTVEMASITNPYEVAIIDEIQQLRDPQRGWAWTRAVLGLCAREIHVCGEGAAIDLVRELAMHCGEDVEVKRYERLTSLSYLDRAVEKFTDVKPGDCIVCFNKNDIYYVTKQLEKIDKECAVIYGALPPSTKLAQAEKFNDPSNDCNYLVATDAIGMGLNLAIKRVIFYSMMKPQQNEEGIIEMDMVSTSQALQIGGRAGRYGTQYENGEVTTFFAKDLQVLHNIVNKKIESIEKGGLHPTADQIELFAFHLPNASLSNLIDIFVLSSELEEDRFFMCHLDNFKFLADMIEHIPLSLRTRYVFCCSPISVKQPFACAMFVKFARKFSRSEALDIDWVYAQLQWPLEPPRKLVDLIHLENCFDVLDLYLWLSYRFPEMFPDCDNVRKIQKELDLEIQEGVKSIVKLAEAQDLSNHGGDFETEDFHSKALRRAERILKQNAKEKDELYENIKPPGSNSSFI